MTETIPQSSPESIEKVKRLFNLDPANNEAIINAIAYLYERVENNTN